MPGATGFSQCAHTRQENTGPRIRSLGSRRAIESAARIAQAEQTANCEPPFRRGSTSLLRPWFRTRRDRMRPVLHARSAARLTEARGVAESGQVRGTLSAPRSARDFDGAHRIHTARREIIPCTVLVFPVWKADRCLRLISPMKEANNDQRAGTPPVIESIWQSQTLEIVTTAIQR